MPAKFKVIQPTRIKDAVFREEILNELRKVEKNMLKDYQKTTQTWEHKVEFEHGIKFPKGSPGVVIETGDQIYAYVNLGTKAHMIFPKRPGGMLSFLSTYTAKTMPGVIGSRSGGSSGDRVFSRGVHHPGTEARLFDQVIMEKWEPLFSDAMDAAIARAARKCGHGMS